MLDSKRKFQNNSPSKKARKSPEDFNKVLKDYYGELSCPLKYSKPYELVIAVILSAQCTDDRVNQVTPDLFKRFFSLEMFAFADLREIEKLIFSTGFFRNKARSIQGFAKSVIDHHNGEVPSTMEELIQLPGIGRKTANVVLNEVFDLSEGIVVDTHVKRISKRLGLTKNTDPAKIEKDLMKKLPKNLWKEFSLYLVFLGREFCKARETFCTSCPLGKICPSSKTGG